MYKRFTEKRNGKNVIPLLNSVRGVDLPKWTIAEESDIRQYLSGDAVDKFAELEDKIENGTLIELPCKVGTTLYFIYNRPYADKPILTPKIHETSNWYFDIDKKGVAIVARNPYGYNGEYFYYLGEKVFLTKAEAEAKLKELKNERF